MAAIRPFRHLIVYSLMLRRIEQAWQARADEPTPAQRLARRSRAPHCPEARRAALTAAWP